jgi:hypothetical protein
LVGYLLARLIFERLLGETDEQAQVDRVPATRARKRPLDVCASPL